MDISTSRYNGYCVIDVGSKLSVFSILDPLKDLVARLLLKKETNIVIRLSEPSNLSSHSIGVLVWCNETIRTAGGELTIAGCKDQLDEYLSAMGIANRFSIVPSLEKPEPTPA